MSKLDRQRQNITAAQKYVDSMKITLETHVMAATRDNAESDRSLAPDSDLSLSLILFARSNGKPIAQA